MATAVRQKSLRITSMGNGFPRAAARPSKTAIPRTRTSWSACSRRRPRRTWTRPSTPRRRAFKDWRLTPAPKRAEILFRAAEILIERKEDFASDMTREMGKVLAETRGDVQEAIDMTYLMAGEGRRLFGQTTPSELPNKFAMSVRAPLGVAGLITPWNFPMAIPSWKIDAGAGLRQHGGDQAGRRHAAFHLQPGRKCSTKPACRAAC